MPVSSSAREVRFGTKRFRLLGAFWNQEEGAFYGQETHLAPTYRCAV
jgi:hypothetical protein